MGPWGSGPSLSPWEATSSCPGSCSPRAGPMRSLHLPVGPEHPGCVGAAELGQPGLRALPPVPTAGASLRDLWCWGGTSQVRDHTEGTALPRTEGAFPPFLCLSSCKFIVVVFLPALKETWLWEGQTG